MALLTSERDTDRTRTRVVQCDAALVRVGEGRADQVSGTAAPLVGNTRVKALNGCVCHHVPGVVKPPRLGDAGERETLPLQRCEEPRLDLDVDVRTELERRIETRSTRTRSGSSPSTRGPVDRRGASA